MSISDYSLIDQALAALSSPVRGLVNYENVPLRFNTGQKPFDASKIEFTKLTRYSRERIQETYKILRQTKRYVISNDLLHYIAHLSYYIRPDELLKLIANARPPHDLMWIEWDEEARQKSLLSFSGLSEDKIENQLHNSYHTDYVGYFIEDFDFNFFSDNRQQDNCHWIFTPVVPFGIKRDSKSEPLKIQKILFNSGGFTLSTNPWTDKEREGLLKDFLQEVTIDLPTLNEANENILEKTIDILSYDRFKKLYQNEEEHWPVYNTLKKLSRYINFVQTRAINWHIPRGNSEDKNYNQQQHNNLINSEFDIKGDAKFLICLLSVLNYDWVIKEKKPAEKQRRMRYGKQIRYDSHIVCEIDLPKKNGISISVSNPDPQGSKRMHDVRGHFRRLQSGKRTWVREHRRGNKNLGVITKDYVLTSKNKGEINANIL